MEQVFPAFTRVSIFKFCNNRHAAISLSGWPAHLSIPCSGFSGHNFVYGLRLLMKRKSSKINTDTFALSKILPCYDKYLCKTGEDGTQVQFDYYPPVPMYVIYSYSKKLWAVALLAKFLASSKSAHKTNVMDGDQVVGYRFEQVALEEWLYKYTRQTKYVNDTNRGMDLNRFLGIIAKNSTSLGIEIHSERDLSTSSVYLVLSVLGLQRKLAKLYWVSAPRHYNSQLSLSKAAPKTLGKGVQPIPGDVDISKNPSYVQIWNVVASVEYAELDNVSWRRLAKLASVSVPTISRFNTWFDDNIVPYGALRPPSKLKYDFTNYDPNMRVVDRPPGYVLDRSSADVNLAVDEVKEDAANEPNQDEQLINVDVSADLANVFG